MYAYLIVYVEIWSPLKVQDNIQKSYILFHIFYFTLLFILFSLVSISILLKLLHLKDL